MRSAFTTHTEIHFRNYTHIEGTMAFKQTTIAVSADFRTKFDSWFAACQKKRKDHYGFEYPGLVQTTRYELETSEGGRYIRILAKEYNRQTDEQICCSVWAFIDKSNGDVLKPKDFKSPAKGARGNIFDEHNGMHRISPYGPEYNR